MITFGGTFISVALAYKLFLIWVSLYTVIFFKFFSISSYLKISEFLFSLEKTICFNFDFSNIISKTFSGFVLSILNSIFCPSYNLFIDLYLDKLLFIILNSLSGKFVIFRIFLKVSPFWIIKLL